MKCALLFVLLAIFMMGSVSSHTTSCGFQSVHDTRLQSEPLLKEQYQSIVRKATDHVERNKRNILMGPLRIPLVWHVLTPPGDTPLTRATIEQEIVYLNQWFQAENVNYATQNTFYQSRAAEQADLDIIFEFAAIDLNGDPFDGLDFVVTDVAIEGNCTSDVVFDTAEGGVTPWDPSRYLNVYSCNLVGNNVGFATLPGNSISPNFDGFITATKFVGSEDFSGSTSAHEIGHWLGLLHTYGDGMSGCSSDDGIDDTPVVDIPAADYGGDCAPPGDDNIRCTEPAMTQNIMDLNFERCIAIFSKGQAEVMRFFLTDPSTIRSTLPSSDALAVLSSTTVSTSVSASAAASASTSASTSIAASIPAVLPSASTSAPAGVSTSVNPSPAASSSSSVSVTPSGSEIASASQSAIPASASSTPLPPSATSTFGTTPTPVSIPGTSLLRSVVVSGGSATVSDAGVGFSTSGGLYPDGTTINLNIFSSSTAPVTAVAAANIVGNVGTIDSDPNVLDSQLVGICFTVPSDYMGSIGDLCIASDSLRDSNNILLTSVHCISDIVDDDDGNDDDSEDDDNGDNAFDSSRMWCGVVPIYDFTSTYFLYPKRDIVIGEAPVYGQVYAPYDITQYNNIYEYTYRAVNRPVPLPVPVNVPEPVPVSVDVPVSVSVPFPVANPVPVPVPYANPVGVPVANPVVIPNYIDVPVDVPVANPVAVEVPVPVIQYNPIYVITDDDQ